MTISTISSTQSPSVSGRVAHEYAQYKKAHDASPAPLLTPAGSPTENANTFASVIANRFTQLGLPSASGTSTYSALPTNGTLSAPFVSQPKASPVQQYQNFASISSDLAQALTSNANSATSSASGSGGLSTMFQDVWSSLNTSSAMTAASTADTSSNTPSNFPSFVQTLARNFSESGISGLRGVFVDTVA